MQSMYIKLMVDKIEMDFVTPHIAKYIEEYEKYQILSDKVRCMDEAFTG